MNALTLQRPAALPATLTHPEPVGEVTAVVAVAANVLLVLGWQSEKPPAEGVAQLERRRTDSGPFRCASWRREQGAHAFVAAVQLPPGTEPRPGQRLTLRNADRPALMAVLPDAFADLTAFAAAAGRLLEAHLDGLVRFLLGIFPADAAAHVPGVPLLLALLLPRAAEDDGCIELAGAIAGECAFVQGWGRAPDGVAHAVLMGADGTVALAPAQTATFRRDDIAAPASGLVTVLPAAVSAALGRLEALFLISAGGILRRPVLERRVLDAGDSIGHLRGMLSLLRSSTSVLESLRAALQPRYEGRETLAALGAPVRATVDVALWHPTAGLYLHGWLFDPDACVTSVSLANTSRHTARLDGGWTRVPRADVSAAFATDLAFGVPAHDEHGFAAHVSAPMTQERLHLIVELASGERGFVPVPARPLLAPGGIAAALGSVDLYKPSGHAIIESQLAPFIAASLRRENPASACMSPHAASIPAEPHTAERLAIVAALPGAPVLPRALLSQFVRERLRAHEELILVVGPAWHRGAVDRLEAQARALDVRVQIIASNAPIDEPGTLLRIAAAHSSAAQLMLVAPSLIGRTNGWRDALSAATRLSLGPAAVCPTVLYEDLSIRHAGQTRMIMLRSAPYVRVVRELAGLPAAFAGDGLPVPTVLGTLQCCLLPRLAALAFTQDGPTALSVTGREIAFFLRLHTAGIGCLWAPSVQVFATESEDAMTAGVAADPACLVDLWGLRAALDGAILRPLEG